jgi:hypothetical protein
MDASSCGTLSIVGTAVRITAPGLASPGLASPSGIADSGDLLCLWAPGLWTPSSLATLARGMGNLISDPQPVALSVSSLCTCFCGGARVQARCPLQVARLRGVCDVLRGHFPHMQRPNPLSSLALRLNKGGWAGRAKAGGCCKPRGYACSRWCEESPAACGWPGPTFHLFAKKTA